MINYKSSKNVGSAQIFVKEAERASKGQKEKTTNTLSFKRYMGYDKDL